MIVVTIDISYRIGDKDEQKQYISEQSGCGLKKSEKLLDSSQSFLTS